MPYYPPPLGTYQPITLGYAEVANNPMAGTFVTETDLTNMTVTVTVPAGRRLKITVFATLGSSVANDEIVLYIKEGSTFLAYAAQSAPVANRDVIFHREVVVTPSAGTHTYKVAAGRNIGTGNISFVGAAANAALPSFVLVEDVTGTSQAYQSAAVPVGVLARIQDFSSGVTVALSASLTHIAGSALTISVPDGRLLKFTAKIHASSSTAGARIRLAVLEGSTVVGIGGYRILSGGSAGEELEVVGFLSPTAGAHTYDLGWTQDSGAGSATLYTNPTDETNLFVIEDVTPTPASGTGAPSSTLALAQPSQFTGFSNATGGIAFYTAEADIPNTNVTITVPAGRRIKLTAQTLVNSSVAGDEIRLQIKEGSTYLQTIIGISPAGSAQLTLSGSVVINPSAGTHTYILRLQRWTGTGNVQFYQDASSLPTYLLVEDITGVSMPKDSSIGTIDYILNASAGVGSTASGTFVDYPGTLDKSFSKGLTTTSLIVRGTVSAYKATNIGSIFIGLSIAGTDYAVGQFFFNDFNSHRAIPFYAKIATGLAAGTYTARVRWRTDSSNANTDANDIVQISITEAVTA